MFAIVSDDSLAGCQLHLHGLTALQWVNKYLSAVQQLCFVVAHRWHCTGQWVRGFCNVPHAQTDTTGMCEGWHLSIKGGGLAEKSRLRGRRLDWLLHKLFYEVKLYQIAVLAWQSKVAHASHVPPSDAVPVLLIHSHSVLLMLDH